MRPTASRLRISSVGFNRDDNGLRNCDGEGPIDGIDMRACGKGSVAMNRKAGWQTKRAGR